MNITLTNNRHETKLTLKYLMREREYKGKKAIQISATTYRKIKFVLCNDVECDCLNAGQTEYTVIRDNWPNHRKYSYFILLNQED